MKNLISKITILILSIFIFSCSNDDDNTTAIVLPDAINLQEASLYPESFVYDETTQKTFVGSYFKGKIITTDLNGNLTDFIEDQTLVAVVGMAIDKANNRLLVCNSDAGISMRSDASTIGIIAEVIAYDLTTGAKLTTIDLSGLYAGGHFLNDLVLDTNGNIYVTDSFSPVIYKIDTSNTASVLVTDAIFEVPQGAFGLNGLVFHPDNYLIIGKAFGGILYKIPLSNPTNIQQVTLNTSVNALDGLHLINNNTLALVSNNFTGAAFEEAVYKIETTDSWATATITGSVTALNGIYPTSVSNIEDGLYVNFGYFPELIDPKSAPNNNFKLQKIEF